MTDLLEGQKAPDFSLEDESGRAIKLSQFRGQTVVLYFYPEDDTPGCTEQACGFRDHISAFEELDAVVIGVSPDDSDSHRRFRAKHRLPFLLLSDPGHKVATRYGAYGEKLLYGQRVVGTIRSTVVIDPQGRVKSVHRNVRTAGHAQRMLDAARR